jgi:parvulin-like peptidyl-prolyl isomerase
MNSLNCLNDETIMLLHKNNLLKPLLKTEIIKKNLINIKIEKKDKENAIKELLKKFKIEEGKNLDDWLKSNNFTHSEFEYLSLFPLRLEKHIKENFSHQVEARFLERKNQLDIVLYSLIRVRDFAKAREIYIRASEGEESFGNLAQKFSEGPEKDVRGFVGPIALERSNPVFAEHLRNSQPGVVQHPLKIAASYLVYRVEYLRSARLDESMRKQMEEELFNKSIEAEINNCSEELVSKVINNQNNDIN